MAFDLNGALDRAPAPKGKATTASKRQYSDDLSREISASLASSIRTHFPHTTAGIGTGVPAASASGLKSIDVAFNIIGIGLGLGISVKCVGLPEGSKGYTHNFKRVHEEWTTETVLYHRYQPHAIVVGMLFLPAACMTDRKLRTSLSTALEHFRVFAGRTSVHADHELMERIYIGVYDTAGPTRGQVRFIDVIHDLAARALPPPSWKLTFEEVKDELLTEFKLRNRRLKIKDMP